MKQTPTNSELSRLIGKFKGIRDDLLGMVEDSADLLQDIHPEHQLSAHNLRHYLALRNHVSAYPPGPIVRRRFVVLRARGVACPGCAKQDRFLMTVTVAARAILAYYPTIALAEIQDIDHARCVSELD